MTKVHQDQRYVEALLNNNGILIQEIYKKSAPKIKVFVQRNNGSLQDAEELFNDGLIKIYQKAKKGDFQLTCPFDYYLYMVCKSSWLNELRKRSRAGVTIQEVEGYENIGEDVFGQVEAQQAQNAQDELFFKKFKELGPSCQNIIKLSIKKIPLKEVAERLGNSYAYVRKKKSECTKRLMEIVRASPEFLLLNK